MNDEQGVPPRFSRNNLIQFKLAELFSPIIIRLLAWTIRWTWDVHPDAAARIKDGGPLLYAFWHGRMLPLVYSHRGRGITVLVTWNRDGEFIARVIERMGFYTIRGSSSRGGQEALRAMANSVRNGRPVGVTPAGPRGPIHSVKPGIVRIAAATGAAIIPTAASAHPSRRLRSWDRFLIPRPFGRCSVVHGKPFVVAEDAERNLDAWVARLRGELLDVSAHADRLVGREGGSCG